MNKWSHLPPDELALVTTCEEEIKRIVGRYSDMRPAPHSAHMDRLLQEYQAEVAPWQRMIIDITSRYHAPIIVDASSELGKQIQSVLGVPE
jgi:hypothetical protein